MKRRQSDSHSDNRKCVESGKVGSRVLRTEPSDSIGHRRLGLEPPWRVVPQLRLK
jgi:hypothetical protein